MDEYIDKKAADNALTAAAAADSDKKRRTWAKAIGVLHDVPAADVVPVVHGKWEWFDEEVGSPLEGSERDWGWRCSACKDTLNDEYDNPDNPPNHNYCPNCGARMDGETK